MPDVDVRLVDVVKRFGDAVAVDHIDLEVQDGEFFSLLGPSGCGKTTTLRMIGGFEEPTSGLIELQGQDVTWLPPYQRNVNTVFQNYALFPHLTIFENVAFGLRRKRVKDAEVKARVSEMLEPRRAARLRAPQADPDLGRPGPARRPRPGAHQSSRPSCSSTSRWAPSTSSSASRCRSSSSASSRRSGITFIYVTHDQEEAMTMSDRIAVMNKGRYEQLGDPESLYERPTTRFVAGFLGVSNLLPGAVEGTRRPARDGPPGRRHAHPRARGAWSTGRARVGHRRPPREDPPARGDRQRARPGTTSCTASSATPPTWASAPSTRSRRAAARG